MLFLNLMMLVILSSCGDDEPKGPGPEAPKDVIAFSISENFGVVELTWAENRAVDVYRQLGSGSFECVSKDNTAKRYTDDLKTSTDLTDVSYRVVLSGGKVNSIEALRSEKEVTICVLTDEELVDLVQSRTLKYFTDFAHPQSGMARERNASGDVVTTGGTGFGIMAILAGANSGYITQADAYKHIRKITDFLMRIPRFHGAFAHWYNGATGEVQPFSEKDNGGDIVETSFLFQGLIAAKEYFQTVGSGEALQLVADIDKLWEEMDWSHYVRNGKLMWHWSPDYDFQMNLPIVGWNEGMIAYVLAASSPTFPIEKEVYTGGFQNGGSIVCGGAAYNYILPLGEMSSKGGPLFFAHYSFLGLDPRGLSDGICRDYFEQNKNHTLINMAYCIDNPKNFEGYSESFWGLTASDCPVAGYTAHSPSNDNGTVSPTAAISSMPYTPEQSKKVMRYLYRDLKMLGEYGFYDAVNLSVTPDKQIVKTFLAIDQGPIVVMLENYKSQFIWNTFMRNADVRRGLERLGFTVGAK